jgi:hypothetical protein
MSCCCCKCRMPAVNPLPLVLLHGLLLVLDL